MPAKFDLTAALAKIPEDKRKAVEDVLKEQQAFIDVLDAQATELETTRTAKAELEANLEKINAGFELANAEYSKIIDDLDSTEKEKIAAQAKLEEANKAKIEAERKLAEATRLNPPVDTSKFLTQEQLDAKMREHAIAQTAYFGTTLDTVAEVERLTGQRVSPNALIQEATAAKKTPQQYAEEKYKLGEVRERREKEEKEKHDKGKFDEGYQKALAEMRNPALRTLEASEDPFYVPKEGEKALQPWDQPEGYVPPEEQAFMKEISKTVQ